MNENPNPLLPDDKQQFKGDLEFNDTGDKMELIEQEKFALDQAELRNSELNAVALPSLTAHVFKTVRKNNQIINSGRTGELLKRYGGEEYMQNAPTENITETEAYY
jgi:pre-mRNA-processing factor SLU7